MATSRGAATVTTRADVTEFKRLFSKSSQVDKKLMTALRRNIRQAAGVAADAVKSEVGSGGPLRSAIAAGVKVKVMTGARSGVTIVASSSAMPEGKASLVRAWTARKGWRHPVFDLTQENRVGGKSLRSRTGRVISGAHGSDQVWVQQVGNPGYFDKPITAKRDVVRKAVEDAMEEAGRSLI